MRRVLNRPPLTLWHLVLLLILALSMAACGQTTEPPKGDDPKRPLDDPQPLHDTIAYVAAGGDSIRLIEPDGSHDRELWAHGLNDPQQVYDVWSLAWNPQATRLTFSGTHENWCSLFASDIFSVGADGRQYQRVTQAPSCAELGDYPQGTVRVPVKNVSMDSFSGFMYFQGAAGLQPLNLPPNGTGLVTFPEVADLGPGGDRLQVASLIAADSREILIGSAVDVVGGGAVTTAEVPVYQPGGFWEAHSPTWRHDGSAVTFIYNFNSFMELPVQPDALAFGSDLMAETTDFPLFVDLLARGPTAETANDILYAGTDSFETAGIYRVSEGSAGPGEPLVTFEATESILGLAWMPDGSGFYYSVTEGDYYGEDRSANIFYYGFATATPLRVTSLVGDFVGPLSVSSDGESIVFERAGALVDFSDDLLDPDLWLLDPQGAMTLLVEDARAPAWSR